MTKAMRQIEIARRDMARYLNGDRDVPRCDGYGTPAFVGALWDDLTHTPRPVPGPIPPTYADNRINPVTEVPFGTYGWWVRRLQKTVNSVYRAPGRRR